MSFSLLFILVPREALTEGLEESNIGPAEPRLTVVYAPSNPITIEGDWLKPVVRGSTINCVEFLRSNGIDVPSNPSIVAKTLPVDSTELPPEGLLVILVTYEGPDGHVSYGKNVGGKLFSVLDSIGAHEIPPSLYKGYVVV